MKNLEIIKIIVMVAVLAIFILQNTMTLPKNVKYFIILLPVYLLIDHFFIHKCPAKVADVVAEVEPVVAEEITEETMDEIDDEIDAELLDELEAGNI